MGAIHRLDLTADVTHLLVGDIATEKYRYTAKERQDIKVLLPTWLEAVRDCWIKGGDTDVRVLEEEYKLPALFGLKICVTGFSDPTQRAELQEAVGRHGGAYHGDLTKQVTHLVAKEAVGKKYEFATQWGIKVVGVEWLQDSLARGMALGEGLYHPLRPVEERGIGAVTVKKAVEVGKRKSTESQEVGRRKLRRTASSRLESQSQDLWAGVGGEDVTIKNEEEHTQTRPVIERVDSLRNVDRSTVEVAKVTAQIFNTTGLSGAGEKMVVYGFDSRKVGLSRCSSTGISG